MTLYNDNLLFGKKKKTYFLPFSCRESCIHERIKWEAGEKRSGKREVDFLLRGGKKKVPFSQHNSSARKCLYEKIFLKWKYL